MNNLIKKIKNNKFYIIIFMCLSAYIIRNLLIDYMDKTDGYFILHTGKYILSNGIPTENPFFIQSGHKLIIQQWLWDVIVYGVYLVMGNIGLFLLCLLITFLTGLMFYKIAQLYNADRKIVTFFILLFFMFQEISIRPTLITIFLCLAQIYVLERYKKGQDKTLFFLIIISILEINLHGMLWLFHILIMMAYIFPHVQVLVKTTPHDYKIKPLVLTSILMIASAFINPYGINMITSLWKSSNGIYTQLGISEMQLLPIFTSSGILLLTLIAVTTYLMCQHETPVELFYLFAGLSLLGVTYMRNVIYAYIGIFMVLIFISQNYPFAKFHEFVNKQKNSFYIIGLLAFILISIYPDSENGYIYKEQDNTCTPVLALNYMNGIPEEEKDDVVLFTEFNGGSFFEYHGYKIYMESRGESSVKKLNGGYDVIGEYYKIYNSCTKEKYQKFMDKYNFTHLCVQTKNNMFGFIECDDRFKKVIETKSYSLYERKDFGK